MRTTERFYKAVTKLYNAFHKGELDAFSCYRCAVGNILDNDASWLGGQIGDRPFTLNQELVSGYSSKELNVVELKFMRGVSNIEQPAIFRHDFENPTKET